MDLLLLLWLPTTGRRGLSQHGVPEPMRRKLVSVSGGQGGEGWGSWDKTGEVPGTGTCGFEGHGQKLDLRGTGRTIMGTRRLR